MTELDLDRELEALLQETIKGLKDRINSTDANASDFSASIKLLEATGTIEDMRDKKERAARSGEMDALLDSFPDFDEHGDIIQ